MQRTLCNLLLPSLELLSVGTSVDTGLGEVMNKNLNGQPGVTVKNHESAKRRLGALETVSTKLVSSQLKQLTSTICICECYLLAK